MAYIAENRHLFVLLHNRCFVARLLKLLRDHFLIRKATCP